MGRSARRRSPSTDTSSFSEIEYGGHNQTVRYDGVISPTWLVEGSFARAYNRIGETPSVDQWRVTDTTVVPQVITGGIGFYEQGNKGTNLQHGAKTTSSSAITRSRRLPLRRRRASNVNQRTGPTFTAPDGRQTATGASINIISDPTFSRIWRDALQRRASDQNYWSFFAQDSWRANERLTVNAGLRYDQQTLVGTFTELPTLQGNMLEDFTLKGNWAPRIGAIYDVLGNGRSKLYGNYGRFYARIPNDLAARVLSADDGVTRIDYYDANLTQPIPNGVLAGGQTNHYVTAGVSTTLIDEDATLSYKDEFVAGFEAAWPNINLGVRYIYRNIGRILEDTAQFPSAHDLGSRHGKRGMLSRIPTATFQPWVGWAPPSGPGAQLQRGRVHGGSPVHQQLVAVRQLPLVAPARLVRGLLPEDNGQSDPGITSLFDFPTNDPSYTAIRRTGVPLPGRHPLPR